MNGKYPANAHATLTVAVALTGWLLPGSTMADFDNLGQRLRIQQHKSQFQLMLEQVQEGVRQRAAASHTPSVGQSHSSKPVDLGDWTQSTRLAPIAVTEPPPRALDPESIRRLRTQQAHERDQRRILDHRQQRHALIAGSRSRGPAGLDNFSAKRRQLTRYRSQNQRLTLQRKLRR